MIVGIGLDVCSIERMRRALERHWERFFARICSEAERADLLGRDPAAALAGRFAVKEAFAKALDGAARFVESSLRVFASEIERHRRSGPCRATGLPSRKTSST